MVRKLLDGAQSLEYVDDVLGHTIDWITHKEMLVTLNTANLPYCLTSLKIIKFPIKIMTYVYS